MVVSLLAACVAEGPVVAEPEALVPGAPQVGAAEGWLDLPVGTPLSGYTARCTCMGGTLFQPDDRDSQYATTFIESAGVQLMPRIKVIWISNGTEQLVVAKTDQIYSYDQLVVDLERRLSEATGLDLRGRVVHATNHTHSSWGDYHHGVSWYLGSDKYNEEVYQRELGQIVDVALEAHDAVQPAKIGVGWTKDWDPTDAIYRDRRGENDELQPWGEDGPRLGKDPHLGVIRFDTLEDEPIAMMVNFGMHGIIGGEDNPLASADSGGHLELGLEESFDEKVVVMFTQGSGGDASPAGRQEGYARMESIGVLGPELVLPTYDAIRTSDAPITLESASKVIKKDPSRIHLRRNGKVDLWYTPYDPDPEYFPDNLVYAEDGAILSPIDEFNTASGGMFCGSGDFDLPVGGLAAAVFPYDQCMQVDLLSTLIDVFFQLEDGDLQLPIPESLDANTLVSRIGPVPTVLPDGRRVDQPLLVGFFPGEPLYAYGEQWRRRVKDELGFEQPMIVGYSMDHEGYLTIPEDWLVGGYEPDIGFWGPLEAEYVMEQVLEYAKTTVATEDVREDPDPLGTNHTTVYPTEPLPTARPDLTPEAGTRIREQREYQWTPFIDTDRPSTPQAPTAEELVVPERLPRVQGIVQLAWEGGDPGVDSPVVTLQRQREDGGWEDVTTPSGRVVDSRRPDILLAHTPTPLYPAEAPQTHQWWAGWQAVSPWADRAALPLGTYRLHVEGHGFAPGAETWPWGTTDYSFDSESFEVVPAAITLTEDPAGLYASIVAPADGYRLVHVDGAEKGDNPVEGPVWVEIEAPGSRDLVVVTPEPAAPRSFLPLVLPEGWTRIVATDANGNTGELFPAPPAYP